MAVANPLPPWKLAEAELELPPPEPEPEPVCEGAAVEALTVLLTVAGPAWGVGVDTPTGFCAKQVEKASLMAEAMGCGGTLTLAFPEKLHESALKLVTTLY